MDYCPVKECPFQRLRVELTAKLFRALSDPTRLLILRALQQGPLRVVDLCAQVNRAQPNVSAHLAFLRDSGLVTADPQGRETFYSLASPRVSLVLLCADDLVDEVGPDLCQCRFPSD
jgi:DNA-binding transcriptional ArsR family regulator